MGTSSRAAMPGGRCPSARSSARRGSSRASVRESRPPALQGLEVDGRALLRDLGPPAVARGAALEGVEAEEALVVGGVDPDAGALEAQNPGRRLRHLVEDPAQPAAGEGLAARQLGEGIALGPHALLSHPRHRLLEPSLLGLQGEAGQVGERGGEALLVVLEAPGRALVLEAHHAGEAPAPRRWGPRCATGGRRGAAHELAGARVGLRVGGHDGSLAVEGREVEGVVAGRLDLPRFVDVPHRGVEVGAVQAGALLVLEGPDAGPGQGQDGGRGLRDLPEPLFEGLGRGLPAGEVQQGLGLAPERFARGVGRGGHGGGSGRLRGRRGPGALRGRLGRRSLGRLRRLLRRRGGGRAPSPGAAASSVSEGGASSAASLPCRPRQPRLLLQSGQALRERQPCGLRGLLASPTGASTAAGGSEGSAATAADAGPLAGEPRALDPGREGLARRRAAAGAGPRGGQATRPPPHPQAGPAARAGRP